jgi:hypothetical protein
LTLYRDALYRVTCYIELPFIDSDLLYRVTKRIISESSRKNITKTKRIISESSRKNITKTKRIISESSRKNITKTKRICYIFS